VSSANLLRLICFICRPRFSNHNPNPNPNPNQVQYHGDGQENQSHELNVEAHKVIVGINSIGLLEAMVRSKSIDLANAS
jgi:hypothetical protein